MEPGTERNNEAFLQTELAGTRFADVRWISETGSTNDDLAEQAKNGAGEQALITDLQTAGRGRRNRVWDAPSESGVLMSVLIRDTEPADGFWAVGAVALAACQAIDALTTTPCTLKWPNDVMLGVGADQKKAAGVLAQIVDGAVIVGIGINVNWPAEVPEAMAERGTSINRHLSGATQVDRPPLAADILRRAIGHLDSDRAMLRAAWMAHCSTLGQMVRIERSDAMIVGMAVDIGPDGALQIEEDAGRSWHQVGDVVHLRPAN